MSLRLRRIVELRDSLSIHDCGLASEHTWGRCLADLRHVHLVFDALGRHH